MRLVPGAVQRIRFYVIAEADLESHGVQDQYEAVRRKLSASSQKILLTERL